MAITLYLQSKTPGQSQYGLDTFTEKYKAAETADVVLNDASVPQRGDVHPDYPHMFLTDKNCTETSQSASALDLIYQGCFKDDGEGGPLLPPQKASSSSQIASATSNTSSDIFPSTATNPTTVTFYAISNTLTFISNDVADTSEPDDPPDITSLITWDLGYGVQPGISNPALIIRLLNEVFVHTILENPPDITPIVQGQFWQITKKKTRSLQPYGPPS